MMAKKELQKQQLDAINNVLQAVERGDKKILFSMPVGTGASWVEVEIVKALLQKNANVKILFLMSSESEKQILSKRISSYGISLKEDNKEDQFSVMMVTIPWFNVHKSELKMSEFQYVFCHEFGRCIKLQKLDLEPTLIAYTANPNLVSSSHSNNEFAYIYTMHNAVKDAVLSPTVFPQYYNDAVAGFCERLFEKMIGKIEIQEIDVRYKNIRLDFKFVINGKTFIVEHKSYRDRYTPINMLFASIERLSKTIETDVMETIIILFTEISQKEKQDVYDKYQITIWDITNLLYFTKDDVSLQRELAILTFFPLTNIESAKPVGWQPDTGWYMADKTDGANYELYEQLKNELQNCQKGKANFSLYEKICKQVIEVLFLEDFNYISDQHKTRDKLFRMDFICSLKCEASFWGIIRRHYNSHFIIFECKNYSKKLEQNLIYTTEKYLFDAALRNVAIIISRNGFSSNAQIAADGCLKEHGKLILDITDLDLIKMIERKAEGLNPADYLVEKLEYTLMAISK